MACAQRRSLRRELHLEALRHIILDQERDITDRRTLRVRVGSDPPCAAQGSGQDRDRQRATAEALILHHDTAIFHAVGTAHHQRQRNTRHGDATNIAQERGERHSLAGSIDAAFGVQKGVDGTRCRPALDAAVSEIERGRTKIEKAVIRAGACHQNARRKPALASRQPGIEHGDAGGIRLFRRQNFVVAGNQADLDIRSWIGGRKRSDKDLNAAAAGKSSQTEIGHDEPLGGDVLVALGAFIVGRRSIAGLGRHHVNSRLELANRLDDRKSRHHVAVDVRSRIERAIPELHAFVAGNLARRNSV